MSSHSTSKGIQNSIADAIDSFLHALDDVEACARTFVPAAAQLHARNLKETTLKMKGLVENVGSKDDKVRAEAQAGFDRVIRKLERLLNSRTSTQLENCLFVGLFACYDAFFGKLMTSVFTRKADLFGSIGGSVSLTDLAEASSIEELKMGILDRFVSDLRRKSYEDQFSSMEGMFGLVLRKFPNYPSFIEASQRRHLFTHCDGIVSAQYLVCCKAAGYQFEKMPKVGVRLALGATYFLGACSVVREVGVKLAHTLWRKIFPDDLGEADKHLSETIYSLLQREKWEQAIVLGEFARSQKVVCDKERAKIYLVNYCIALRGGGRYDDASKILQGEDWSDAAPDFKLAKAVLLEEYSQACKLMKVIGKKGELVSEEAYHSWPLFRDFRSNSEFRDAYKAIYGYSFLEELKREAAKTNSEAKEAVVMDERVQSDQLKTDGPLSEEVRPPQSPRKRKDKTKPAVTRKKLQR